MKRFSFSLNIGARVQLGTNMSLPINRLTEEDTTQYITEEDSTQVIISED